MAGLVIALFGIACSGDDEVSPLPTQTGSTPAASPAQATVRPAVSPTQANSGQPSPTPPVSASAPDAPSSVMIQGPLPDLRTPVPPGQGELGRILVTWTDNSSDEDGFRVFQDCGGAPAQLLEVGANVTQYGPLQVCRPGRVGVASFEGAAQSDIAWSR